MSQIASFEGFQSGRYSQRGSLPYSRAPWVQYLGGDFFFCRTRENRHGVQAGPSPAPWRIMLLPDCFGDSTASIVSAQGNPVPAIKLQAQRVRFFSRLGVSHWWHWQTLYVRDARVPRSIQAVEAMAPRAVGVSPG